MLQRPKINLSGVDDLLKDSEIKNTIDLSGVDDELKKKGSTVPNIKSDSEITTGSSDGKGFPKIDTNSVAPGMGVQPNGIVAKKEKKGKIVDYKKPKEDSSFFDYLKENLDTGLATVSKSIYDAPGMVYDYAALITNPIAEVFGADKSQLASSDKLAKDLGFRNIPSETLKKKIAESNEKINAYSINNGGDALSALENGNYSGAAKMIAGTTVQSLPIMAAAMLSGGSAGAMTAIGVSTASTKNAELKDEHPEMSMGTRLKNAATSGVLEATLGHLFTGASGGVIKKILADKGVEAGSRIISNSFRSTIEKSIAKSPLAGAFGEIIEESGVEFGNQLNDMSSGIRTEFDVRAIKNAGISAMGMGGVNTVAVYGAKGYIKAKDYNALKSVNKEIDKLSTQLTNENISPENKEIIASRIDRLVTENKRILGTELEKLKSLPAEVKSELNTINNNLSEIRSKADDIKEDNSIDPEIKEKLLQELNIQSKNAGKRKIEILNYTNDVAINADFSNFEGVEPDFNLENGKISSLPLKEQDRLNKLAVEQITGGDKTIEYTKEQVSQTANEIYKNEQTPTTPEAQPQAEVPQQAEADKVAPHPVEDVVAPSVENIKNNGLKISGVTSIEFEDNDETILYGTKNNKTRISIKGMSKEQIQEEYDFDKQVFDKNKSRDFEAEEIEIKKSIGLTNNEKISALKELKSSKRYNDILENITLPFYETKLNEKQSNPNTPTNGNLPIGANNVGENGITKSETPNAESVPSAVDGGENKGDAEVSDLDHAKSQIDKGVLNWNGDTGAERVNLGIPWADIRKGEKDIKAGKLNTVPAKRLIEALKTAKEKGGYEYVQGAGGQMKKQFVSLEDIQRANNEYELTDAEQKEVDAKEAELSNEYELYFGGLDLETQNDIYENREGIKGMGEEPATSGKSKNDVPNKESEQNSGAKEKTALEKAQEARRAAKAKLVAKRQNLSIASDPKQDAQDLYDYHQALVTEAKEHIKIGVKSLADFAKELGEKVSISIKTAWQEANGEISPITNGEDLGYDFNTVDDEVKANDFKAESGKKSLLNRAAQGGNSQIITDAIESNGLDYKIENREEAKKRAQDFVNEVGTANALEAVRSNQIRGAEKAFVYSTIVDNLMNEIEGATNESDKQELEKIHADLIADLTNEFSQEGTDAGRFIAALNDVYNSSALRYNLTSQINSHKASNNGEISDEVLAKFTEADKRIKELEKLIKEAEAKAEKAADDLAIKNIKEDIDRKKNKTSTSKKSKELANKIRQIKIHKPGIFSSATPASLVWDGAVEIVAKSVEAGGTITEAIQKGIEHIKKSKWYKQLSKEQQQEAEKTFNESINTTEKTASITMGEDGKIKIPNQIFRDYVEAGETDIDVISGKIKESISDEFPDVDVREIRDALSGYGKQVNPSKDDISIEISRLKSLGKLISAYEDASSGVNPLKSGLKRAKPTQEMRELRQEINRLIKENGLDAVDLEKEWASALDKIKSSLKNQIENLDKQIANGEKRKVERNQTELDDVAKSLKEERDAKRKILDDMVGKPELTDEQLIARAEKSLENSIEKLQKEIASGEVEYRIKPSEKRSAKLDILRKRRNELSAIKKQMRIDAGIVEAKRLETAKTNVRKGISELQRRIYERDFSKKEVKPLIEDNELSQLRAEKLAQQEIFDAEKYKDELKNRSKIQKWSDAVLEVWNIERILRATGELSTVLIQGGMLTVSRKFTNPKELGIIIKKLFTSMGSAKKAEKLEGLIKANPYYLLSQKSKLALANTDYKSDVREEQFTGDYANFAWDLPIIIAMLNSKLKEKLSKERSVLGDVLLNPIKKATGIGTVGTDKISIRDQWKNVNPFRVLERGSTLYMNTLRMEEFVRGCEMLRMEGKNEVDHLDDYKLLANAINTMTGRANLPKEVATSSKALAVIFFSARNAVSVVNQVNPIYYGYLHFASTDGFQVKKTSVANKLAMTNFIRFVTITGSMILAIKAGAGEDEEGNDVVEVELDPRSSDFMKIKIGNIRFDPWHGMTGPIVLMSKVFTEEVKNINSGKIEKLEDKRFGDKNRFDLLSRFVRNKFSPSAARLANTLSTNAGIDPETGEAIRVTPFGENYEVEGSFANVKPMYWDAVMEIKKEDPGALAEFLTIISLFGWNTSVYGTKTESVKSKKSVPGIPKFGKIKMEGL